MAVIATRNAVDCSSASCAEAADVDEDNFPIFGESACSQHKASTGKARSISSLAGPDQLQMKK
jgi:hypothetical protein